MTAALSKRELQMTRYLPYQRHVNEHVVALDSGGYMIVLQMDGISFETEDNADINTLHASLAHRWRDLSRTNAASGLSVWTHVVRRRQAGYVEGEFVSEFSRAFNARYRTQFDGVRAFANELFVTLIYKPGTETGEKFKDLVRKLRVAKKGEVEVDEEAIKLLQETADTLESALKKYGARKLGLYERDELMFSEVVEFLHLLGTGVRRPMGLVDGRLGSAICTDRPIFGSEAVEIRGAGEERFAGIFGINEYPKKTRPGMLDSLLKADFEYILTQSFSFVDRTTASEILGRKQNQMVASQDKAASQLKELTKAQDDLQSGVFGMGEHHLVLTIFAPSIPELTRAMSDGRSFLAEASMIVAREDLGIEAAWWAMFPGNFKMRARSAPINTRNFAAFASFHVHPTGRASGNHWGPAVMALKTAAGSPFFLNLHREQLGNTFICGPSGSGKTVLQGVLLSQLEKFGAQRILFDKDRGCEILVRATGGVYLPLKNGVPTGCAPFKALPLNAGNREFLKELLFKLAAHPARPLTPAEEAKLGMALTGLERVPQQARSIAAMIPLLGTNDPDSVGARLSKWARGGELGWVLDNDHDEISVDNPFVGFDMTDFLDNPVIRSPLMRYLFYRVEQLIDGRRIVIDIDEFWKALEDEAFMGLAKDKLKTIRKLNGLMIFGTQSPSDALNSEIAATIVEQCPTKIYMPNPRAKLEDYCGGMGLTKREYRLIREELPDTRKFLIKQDNVSVVAELNLAGYSDELAVISGTKTLVDVCQEARDMAGEDPAAWLPVFHRRRKEPR